MAGLQSAALQARGGDRRRVEQRGPYGDWRRGSRNQQPAAPPAQRRRGRRFRRRQLNAAGRFQRFVTSLGRALQPVGRRGSRSGRRKRCGRRKSAPAASPALAYARVMNQVREDMFKTKATAPETSMTRPQKARMTTPRPSRGSPGAAGRQACGVDCRGRGCRKRRGAVQDDGKKSHDAATDVPAGQSSSSSSSEPVDET